VPGIAGWVVCGLKSLMEFIERGLEMTISKQVIKKICNLAQEGKMIAQIQREDNPDCTLIQSH